MRVVLVFLNLLCVIIIQCNGLASRPNNYKVTESSEIDVGEPLFLTPYIEQGFITEARKAAEVTLEPFSNITSYSGFFTINKSLNKHLFSWFFSSHNFGDPVILWLQGGPGLTSLFGLFAEIGPFRIENDSIALRDVSWTKSHSILFIDNPVGTGYSFTSKENLPHDETQIGEDLYEALRQFFLLFPELRGNEFYIAGESYAGKYIPVISDTVFKKNYDLTESMKINLKGLAIGNGWLDPVNQMDIGDYAFQHGLVDTKTKKLMNDLRDESIVLLRKKKFVESTLVQRKITNIFKSASGYENLYNYLWAEHQETESIITSFVQRDDIRKAIHVGNLTFNPDDAVDTALLGDIMVSVADILVNLLENLRVLIYSGQLDLAVPYPTTVAYLEKLKFDAAEEYRTANRSIWYRDGKIVGYVKSAGNLTEMLIRNAGHLVPMDKPEVAYSMFHNFTRNEISSDNFVLN